MSRRQATRAVVPLALVVNELLTDAVVQSRESGRPGALRVALRPQEGGRCLLCVEHGGSPLAEGGIGRALVTAFVAELGGDLAFEQGPDGTRAAIAFPA